jgi:hypothetical protein
MAGPNPPTPGISGISSTGARVPVPPRRNRSGQLKEGIGSQADPNRPPPGARRVRQNVVEVQIANRRKSIASFESTDGNTYSYYMKHPETGADIPSIRIFAMFLAMRELGLGGDPLNVLSAFRTALPADINGMIPSMPDSGVFASNPVDDLIRAVGEDAMAEVTDLHAKNAFDLGE